MNLLLAAKKVEYSVGEIEQDGTRMCLKYSEQLKDQFEKPQKIYENILLCSAEILARYILW